MVCHRKDRRVDRVPSLSRAARQRFHLGDADEPLRAGDNFDLEGAHVLPALLRRFRAAARTGDGKVTIWGTGTPRRKFLHVDDCADALVFLLRHYSDEQTINVGVGKDVTIGELARIVAEVVGYKGEIGYDTSRPDGTPRKLLDVSRLTALGWQARIALKEGIASTYQWLERELAEHRSPRGFSFDIEHAA
jgi:GDP-L-fucose synthase